MHNVVYFDYKADTDEKKITRDVLEYVNSSGDCYGTNSVEFNRHNIFNDREQAIEWIAENDHQWYGGFAVKYYDFTGVSSKRVDELNQRLSETIASKQEYIKNHSVLNRKATYIGCPNCGSHLSRKHLKTNFCPLCHTDLRAETTQERIKKYESKEKEIQKLIQAEKLKKKSKAKVKWLVKFEYHS